MPMPTFASSATAGADTSRAAAAANIPKLRMAVPLFWFIDFILFVCSIIDIPLIRL
jgi:hypothetical protein